MDAAKKINCHHLSYCCIGLAAGVCFVTIGKDLLPKSNIGQLQLRIREPDGTRLGSD